jgi:hypothetical protein
MPQHLALVAGLRPDATGPPQGLNPIQAGDDGQLRQEPSRRRPDHDHSHSRRSSWIWRL